MIGVAFGLTGTLVEDLGLEFAAFRDIAEAGATWSAQEISAAYDRFDGSLRDGEDVVAALHLALPHLVGRAGIARDFALAQARYVPTHIRPFGDCAEVFAALTRAHIPTVVCSSGFYAVEAAKASCAEFPVPVLVPPGYGRQPIYDLVPDALRLPNDRVWFASGVPGEIERAARLGLNTIALDRMRTSLDHVLEIVSPEYIKAALALREQLLSMYE